MMKRNIKGQMGLHTVINKEITMKNLNKQSAHRIAENYAARRITTKIIKQKKFERY